MTAKNTHINRYSTEYLNDKDNARALWNEKVERMKNTLSNIVFSLGLDTEDGELLTELVDFLEVLNIDHPNFNRCQLIEDLQWSIFPLTIQFDNHYHAWKKGLLNKDFIKDYSKEEVL